MSSESPSTLERKYWGFVRPMPASLLVMLAKQAEDRGMQGLFAPQVYGPPFLPLATAAAVTERVQLASGIAIAATRSPFETAMAALDLDRISGGRFILGLGASVLAWSRGVFGAPEHKPLAHLRETVAAVRHIVSGAHKGLEPFEGDYFRADFREFQPTEPPVRERIERAWSLADSLCIVPPAYGLSPEKLLYYMGMIDTIFYGE